MKNVMKHGYGGNYHKDRHQKTVYSARTVLAMVFDALPKVDSAIDFGCGVGTWLSILKEKGVGEIQGLDGPWVDQDLLEIPRQAFRQVNFEEEVSLDKKYDLAISLEVAEHLSEGAATQFVENLAAASDYVLFSAAIPFQGGTDHKNEQWPEYWAGLFNEKGFVTLDFVRRKIWNDVQIPTWYRQNILMFVKKEQVESVLHSALDEGGNHLPISIVHPDVFLSRVHRMPPVKGSWDLFRNDMRERIKKLKGKSG